jgi:predicted nucleic acid-binding protein
MGKRILVDTNALIRYLGIEMNSGTSEKALSQKGRTLITSALNGHFPLFLSSLSIIEIWSNIENSIEAKEKLCQVVRELYQEENILVVPFSRQTLDKYLEIDIDSGIKENDKIIFACGLEYECDTIITSDGSIIDYCQRKKNEIEVVS